MLVVCELYAGEVYLVAAGNNLGIAGESALQYAEKDAARFVEVMQTLGEVSPRNTRLMLGKTALDVQKALLDIDLLVQDKKLGSERPNVLLVYYSGHADAEGLHLGHTVMTYHMLKERLLSSAAQIRILFIDSCRSGGVTRLKGASYLPSVGVDIKSRVATEGLAIITSSTAGEDSHESDRHAASLFSHHLINALRGAADVNRDDRVTLNEAYHYTYQQTLRSSERTASLQHPSFQYDLKGNGELVLTRQDRAGVADLLIQKPGLYLIARDDRDGAIFAEVSVGGRELRLALPQSVYYIKRRGRRIYHEYKVELSAGKTYRLSDHSFTTQQYAHLVRKGEGESSYAPGLLLLGGTAADIGPGGRWAPNLIVGTSLDLSWMSFSLRGRFNPGSTTSSEKLAGIEHSEYGLGLAAQRYIDFRWLSLSFGVLLEASYRDYSPSGTEGVRISDGWRYGLGGLLGAEKHLQGGLSLLLEAGPMIWFPGASGDGGASASANADGETNASADAKTSDATALPDSRQFMFWAALGLIWRF